MIHDYARFEERETPEDSPRLDTSFHDHELGRDAECESDRSWFQFTKAVEKLLQVSTLDEDGDEQGYCLDWAFDAFQRGDTAATYAAAARAKHRGLRCGDHCPNSCTWCGGIQ